MSEVPDKQIKRLKSLLQEADTNLAAAKELLSSLLGDDEKTISRTAAKSTVAGEKVIEGVFDGQIMLGPEGKSYPVPANYASKSKLVEGDLLKLTIDEDGSFIYKQIDKTPRKQLIGTLVNHDGAYFVEASGKEYKILLASVTYFKIKEGDQVAVIVPENKEDATWAAVETAL